jgi:hypothetical protein
LSALKGYTTYLVGPMDRVVDGGRDWRKEISSRLWDLKINVIDPCDKPIQFGPENPETRTELKKLLDMGKYDEYAARIKEIALIDLGFCDMSDFLIAKVDIDVHMCGTYEEIFTANRMKRPILVWCPQGKNNIPAWLWGRLSHEMFFSTMDELIDHIATFTFSANTHRRWRRFSVSDIFKGMGYKRITHEMKVKYNT